MRKNKTIKILVVAESLDVEDSSGTKGRVALIQNLQKAGFDLKVLHYTPKDINLEGIACKRIPENRRSIIFFLSRLQMRLRKKVKWNINKPLESFFGFSLNLLNDRNSIIRALIKLDNYEPDLVLTLSKGGSFRPHHALLKIPYWHHKWVAYIHDPYPMHLYPRPYAWVEPGYEAKYNFIKKMTEAAAFLAFPSKLLKEWMGSYFPQCLPKGIIIPHQITEIGMMKVKFPDYFDSTHFNVLHAGNLLWGRDPKGLVEGFKLFLKRNPEAKFRSRLLILGRGSPYSTYLKEISKKFDELYISEKYVPYEEVLNMQNSTSVNVILEAKSEISPFLPGKFPHCVRADKPILLLGPFCSESRNLLGPDYPYWADIDEIDKISEIIEKLFELWKDNKDLKLNRSDLHFYLSEKYLQEKIYEILNM